MSRIVLDRDSPWTNYIAPTAFGRAYIDFINPSPARVFNNPPFEEDTHSDNPAKVFLSFIKGAKLSKIFNEKVPLKF